MVILDPWRVGGQVRVTAIASAGALGVHDVAGVAVRAHGPLNAALVGLLGCSGENVDGRSGPDFRCNNVGFLRLRG